MNVDVHYSKFSIDTLHVREGTTVRFLIHNNDPIHHEFIVGDASGARAAREGHANPRTRRCPVKCPSTRARSARRSTGSITPGDSSSRATFPDISRSACAAGSIVDPA